MKLQKPETRDNLIEENEPNSGNEPRSCQTLTKTVRIKSPQAYNSSQSPTKDNN